MAVSESIVKPQSGSRMLAEQSTRRGISSSGYLLLTLARTRPLSAAELGGAQVLTPGGSYTSLRSSMW